MAVKFVELHHHSVRVGASQIFTHDPFGNMVELHEAGTCRCREAERMSPRSRMS